MDEQPGITENATLDARPVWARLAYVSEFLLALAAIFIVWSEVGGQEHLDLIPWYYKLSLTIALAWAIVAATASAVSHSRAWNRRTLVFLAAAFLIAATMGLLTYYAHLHEDDEADNGNTIALSFRWPAGQSV